MARQCKKKQNTNTHTHTGAAAGRHAAHHSGAARLADACALGRRRALWFNPPARPCTAPGCDGQLHGCCCAAKWLQDMMESPAVVLMCCRLAVMTRWLLCCYAVRSVRAVLCWTSESCAVVLCDEQGLCYADQVAAVSLCCATSGGCAVMIR
eukprot:1148759-Pelagomonas_calceolata.AAC.1